MSECANIEHLQHEQEMALRNRLPNRAQLEWESETSCWTVTFERLTVGQVMRLGDLTRDGL